MRGLLDLRGHPNIVSVLDFGFEQHGISGDIYIAMELLTGLDSVLKSRALSTGEVITLAKSICCALEACEASALIHRDIKPSNIMTDRFGAYKLGDFGTSRTLA